MSGQPVVPGMSQALAEKDASQKHSAGISTGPAVPMGTTVRPQKPEKPINTFLLEVTWGKILFMCGTVFATFVLVIGSVFLAFYISYNLRERTPPEYIPVPAPVAPAVSDEKAAPAAFFVPEEINDLTAAINDLRGALPVDWPNPVLSQNVRRDILAINEKLDALPDKNQLNELFGCLPVVHQDEVKNSSTNYDELWKVLDKKIAPLMQRPQTNFSEKVMEEIGQLKAEFQRMSAMYRVAHHWGDRLPPPASAPQAVQLTDAQKIQQLTDYAESFAFHYEQVNPKSKDAWDKSWRIVTEDKDLQIAANNRFLPALLTMKDKNVDEIGDEDAYNVCRLFLAYRDGKLALPSIFVEKVIKDKDTTSYFGMVNFIKQKLAKLK